MKNFRHIKFNLLLIKSIIYRLGSMLIFGLLFGKRVALIAGCIAFAWYYIYDWIFHKLFRLSTEEGFTIWLTGLPCSGKSTIADALAIKLKKKGIKVERLDGDIIRNGKLSNDLGFSKEDRDKNINRITFVSKLLSRNGIAVLASFVSPYRKTRQMIRESVTNFIEVLVYCNADECARRDVKGMWAKAKRGEIKNFTGYDDPYEIPYKCEIILDTENYSVEECVNKIIRYLNKRKLI